jgi:hypothetical protein
MQKPNSSKDTNEAGNMQTTSDEKRFIPLTIEKGRARAWQLVRLNFLLFQNMKTAGRKRLFLYAAEGTGYAKARSAEHNKRRFPSARLFPQRESAQARAERDTKAQERKRAIIALRYGKRFNTVNKGTLGRANAAGIRIKPNSFILPYAAYKQQIKELLLKDEGQIAPTV